MSIKHKVKSLIGDETVSDIRAFIKYCKTWKPNNKRIVILSQDVINKEIIGQKGKHVFCGYFDIDPQNPKNGNQFLVHTMPIGAKTGSDAIGVGVANLETGEIVQLAETKAWCWQMGSRLRWSSKANEIFFNSYDEEGYCCLKMDVSEKKIIQRIPEALYDIAPDESFGLSINFERLQALRPGYGYCCIGKSNIDQKTPENDGLYYVDLINGKKKLLISLKELSDLYPGVSDGIHYINHVSISPDSKNAIFFHIWTCKEKPGWKANLCRINIQSGQVEYLETKDQVSHYDWVNTDEVLITAVDKETGICNYRIYSLCNRSKKVIQSEFLRQDGHPVHSLQFNGFYSDTYPDKKEYQKLFKFSYERGYQELAAFYSDPRMYNSEIARFTSALFSER